MSAVQARLRDPGGRHGSGKSTSLARCGYRNEKTRGHIVTIEDPVEYVHAHKGCWSLTRGRVDAESWHLPSRTPCARRRRDTHRRNRDARPWSTAFNSRDRHLVLRPCHANSSNQALDRIINFFPEERVTAAHDLSLNIPRSFLSA